MAAFSFSAVTWGEMRLDLVTVVQVNGQAGLDGVLDRHLAGNASAESDAVHVGSVAASQISKSHPRRVYFEHELMP